MYCTICQRVLRNDGLLKLVTSTLTIGTDNNFSSLVVPLSKCKRWDSKYLSLRPVAISTHRFSVPPVFRVSIMCRTCSRRILHDSRIGPSTISYISSNAFDSLSAKADQLKLMARSYA